MKGKQKNERIQETLKDDDDNNNRLRKTLIPWLLLDLGIHTHTPLLILIPSRQKSKHHRSDD